MLRFIGLMVVLLMAFGLGYYVGQQPVGEWKAAVTQLSRNVLGTTLGVERDLRMRQGLVDAKSHLLQAKSEILDRNYGRAKQALGDARDDLEKAAGAGAEESRDAIASLTKQLKQIEADLSHGARIDRSRLDQAQKELDGLL